jgi:hypothetical protein
MPLWVVKVWNHEMKTCVDWYFEEHTHYIRAEKAAKDADVFVDSHEDFVSDIDEFKSWLAESNLCPR